MRRYLFSPVHFFTVALVATTIAAQVRAAETPTAEVDQFFKSYIEAFASGDAEKLAALWTEDAEWTDDATGEHSTGRETVKTDFAAFFAAHPGATLRGDVKHAKQVAPGVVCINGEAIVSAPGEEPTTNCFSAVLVSQEGAWRLASVHETAPPAAEPPFAKLKELDFLIGDWRDDGGDAEVKTSFRWAADGAFLVRAYSVTRDDGSGEKATTSGTQIIGWDPRERRLRSWNFVSDGSFGEGNWTNSGDEWIGRLSQVTVDGGTASAMQILRRIDDDTLEVKTVGAELNGEPQPSQPAVRVVRVPAADEQAPAAPAANAGGTP